MHAIHDCDTVLAPWGCLAVPSLCVRLLMNHDLGLFELSRCAKLVHVSDEFEQALALWVVLLYRVCA